VSPQGSLLGPILFLIYINDIDEYIVSKLVKFADDTSYAEYFQNSNMLIYWGQILNQIYQWSFRLADVINVDKCNCLHMGYIIKNMIIN